MSLTEAQLQAYIDAIDTAIAALLTRKVQRYKIGKREFEFYDLPALRDLREHYVEQIEAIPTAEETVYDDTDL